MRHRSILIALAAGAVALGAAACGDDDGSNVRETGTGTGSATGTGTGTGTGSATGTGVAGECVPVGDLAEADTRVDVELTEWAIDLAAPTAPTGAVGFAAQNDGEDPHEIVIVEGVTPVDLPTDDDGAVDEEQLPEGALIGEIEEFPSDTSCSGVFDLAPGEYTLFCNIVEEEDGEIEAHYAEGMVTTFTVG